MCRYDSTWYYIPLKAQKLLLFVMLRSLKECEFNLSGLFVPCYEGFSAVIYISGTSSYNLTLFNFTLLKSLIF